MDPSDSDANAAASSTSFETSSTSSVTSNQVVDNTDAVNAGGSATCLCGHRVGSSGEPHISVTVAPTTGGQFEIKVSKSESIDSLKKTISKRLKVPKERICLLWKDRYSFASSEKFNEFNRFSCSWALGNGGGHLVSGI